jgi:hypothetical protein
VAPGAIEVGMLPKPVAELEEQLDWEPPALLDVVDCIPGGNPVAPGVFLAEASVPPELTLTTSSPPFTTPGVGGESNTPGNLNPRPVAPAAVCKSSPT